MTCGSKYNVSLIVRNRKKRRLRNEERFSGTVENVNEDINLGVILSLVISRH